MAPYRYPGSPRPNAKRAAAAQAPTPVPELRALPTRAAGANCSDLPCGRDRQHGGPLPCPTDAADHRATVPGPPNRDGRLRCSGPFPSPPHTGPSPQLPTRHDLRLRDPISPTGAHCVRAPDDPSLARQPFKWTVRDTVRSTKR